MVAQASFEISDLLLNSYSRVQVRALPHNRSAVQLRLRDVALTFSKSIL